MRTIKADKLVEFIRLEVKEWFLANLANESEIGIYVLE